MYAYLCFDKFISPFCVRKLLNIQFLCYGHKVDLGIIDTSWSQKLKMFNIFPNNKWENETKMLVKHGHQFNNTFT